jgi:predicted regulator of Ras-like GTPase activity (Roadblock/LC7/MglB family)
MCSGENPVSMERLQMAKLQETKTLIVDPPVDVDGRSLDRSLVQALETLANEIGGVRAAVVGDRSGLPIVSTFRGPSSMTTTAMATLALSAATKVTSSLNLPEPDDILIEAGGWRVIVQLLGNGFTLTCVLPAEGNLGLVKLAMQSRGREIRELLDELV